MGGTSSMLHVRVDDRVKAAAAAALADSGLTVSDAVRILLNRIVAEGGLPPGLVASAETYDRWFRAKVLAALATPADPATTDHVDAEAQNLIDRARLAKA
jgi:DNA-damage-inducible protein J